MNEISSLVKEFDDRIELSADKLYYHFGKENGKKQLQEYFSDVSWVQYDDSLYVTDVGRILRTFKIKKNVEVTDNGKIII